MLAVIQTENESNRQGGDVSNYTTEQRSEPSQNRSTWNPFSKDCRILRIWTDTESLCVEFTAWNDTKTREKVTSLSFCFRVENIDYG